MNLQRPRKAGRTAGFTLIELMVAMLLGLIVIAGVVSVFLANLQSYHSNTALSEIQTNARIAYALMARDIRQAGLTGCNSREERVANVLDTTTDWWANWGNAVHGYDQTQTDPALASSARLPGTDSVQLLGAKGSGMTVSSVDVPTAKFTLNAPSDDLNTGDIIMVCNPDHATIVQVTNYNGAAATVVHQTGSTVTPGNFSKGLGFPSQHTTNGNTYAFGKNSRISILSAQDWYVGPNTVGGNSLYRVTLSSGAGGATTQAQEMVRNVTGMQIEYHQDGAAGFVAASAVSNWAIVDAVRVTLILRSTQDRVGTDQQPLTRSFTTTTTIRNRVP